MEIELKKVEWMLEASPELYDTNPRKYQIWKKDYGLYTKAEAETICLFLRKNGIQIIYDGLK